jgi:hypothetical protein
MYTISLKPSHKRTQEYTVATHKAICTRVVHKVSFPLGPQVANRILREATACT